MMRTRAGLAKTLFGEPFWNLCLMARIDLCKNDMIDDEFDHSCQGMTFSHRTLPMRKHHLEYSSTNFCSFIGHSCKVYFGFFFVT